MRPSQKRLVFLPDDPQRRVSAFPYEVRVLRSSDPESDDIVQLRSMTYADGSNAGEYIEPADSKPHSVHMAAYRDQACVAAVRMTIKNWNDAISTLPCAAVYGSLQSQGLRKLSIAELSHLVIDPRVAGAEQRTLLYSAMVRAGLLAVHAARIAMIVIAVQPEWMTLFTRILKFHTLGAPQQYPPSNVPMTLVGANMIGAGRREMERHAFFSVSEPEIVSMRAALLRCLGDTPQMHVLTQPVESRRA
jgi:hypothetical protein